ncbi:hypothetical protein [Aquiflexum gelatinilyticum]|uniref:hypothetical protein n=1 Tax=Aquiflexum gelatinilyticum TaxID=2961943 RepID=UPI0021696D87|nr:hypothetical protein [Aquiflexum gelatinilyticum]MCS4433052.1 hypothetical protein [Aquiflexum gelatinilyticum]
MKTEAQLNAEILAATVKIKEYAPELEKFISEMPVTIPEAESALVNNKILSDYLDSLNQLLRKYDEEKLAQFKLSI